jgi:hypothetical protein
VQVTVEPREARRLRLSSGRRPAVVGRASGAATARRPSPVTVRLSARARRRLRGARRITLRLTIEAVDRRGNKARLSRRVLVRR